MSAISGMNISMKNNNRRTKREAFSTITGESDKESQGIKIEPVSETVLTDIRSKLKKQQKVEKIKNIATAIISVMVSVFLIWFAFVYFQNDPGVGFEPY